MKYLWSCLSLLVMTFSVGCQTAPGNNLSSGSITTDDMMATATIQRLSAADQYRTQVTIERIDENGSREVIASPEIITLAGQPGMIEIENDENHISVEIHIPTEEKRLNGAEVFIVISEHGELVASPHIRLVMPG